MASRLQGIKEAVFGMSSERQREIAQMNDSYRSGISSSPVQAQVARGPEHYDLDSGRTPILPGNAAPERPVSRLGKVAAAARRLGDRLKSEWEDLSGAFKEMGGAIASGYDLRRFDSPQPARSASQAVNGQAQVQEAGAFENGTVMTSGGLKNPGDGNSQAGQVAAAARTGDPKEKVEGKEGESKTWLGRYWKAALDAGHMGLNRALHFIGQIGGVTAKMPVSLLFKGAVFVGATGVAAVLRKKLEREAAQQASPAIQNGMKAARTVSPTIVDGQRTQVGTPTQTMIDLDPSSDRATLVQQTGQALQKGTTQAENLAATAVTRVRTAVSQAAPTRVLDAKTLIRDAASDSAKTMVMPLAAPSIAVAAPIGELKPPSKKPVAPPPPKIAGGSAVKPTQTLRSASAPSI